jgi:hypothetical protein
MYADDIVIFFLSPEGLQNKLFSPESYCDDWGVKVNIKKTKVIIFNKAGRSIKHKFIAVGNVTGQNQYSSVNMMGDH